MTALTRVEEARTAPKFVDLTSLPMQWTLKTFFPQTKASKPKPQSNEHNNAHICRAPGPRREYPVNWNYTAEDNLLFVLDYDVACPGDSPIADAEQTRQPRRVECGRNQA
jgi:hypothetical protein